MAAARTIRRRRLRRAVDPPVQHGEQAERGERALLGRAARRRTPRPRTPPSHGAGGRRRAARARTASSEISTAERRQQLGTADDAGHRFGVNGMHGEEQGGGEARRPASRAGARARRRHGDRHQRVQGDVDEMKAERRAADAGIGRVGQHGERSIQPARVVDVQKKIGRRQHLHRGVVADETDVVESEVGAQRVEVGQYRHDGDEKNLECGSLLTASGWAGLRGPDHRPPPTPKRPQAAALQSGSKLPHSRI